MREYCDDADPRPGKWKLVRRRFVALDKAVIRCFDFVAELGGKVPVGAEPVFKSEQDAHEYVRLGAFIAERALPFIEFWADAVDVVEASGTLTITASDIPRRVDEDTGRDFYFERLMTRTAAARARETFCEPVNCGVLLANVLAQLFNGFGALIVAVRQGYHLRARRTGFGRRVVRPAQRGTKGSAGPLITTLEAAYHC